MTPRTPPMRAACAEIVFRRAVRAVLRLCPPRLSLRLYSRFLSWRTRGGMKRE
jgi:hypothetical protein